MAVVNTNSTLISNITASPSVRNDSRHSAGRLRVKSETISSVSTDSATSTYRFFRVKANDSIKSLMLYNDALAVSGANYDFGVYATGDSGAAVDADCYGTVVTMNAAVTAGAELRFETLNITTVNQRVWEDAGVATEPAPGTEYDLVVTVNARGSTPATGDITLVMTYTAGD